MTTTITMTTMAMSRKRQLFFVVNVMGCLFICYLLSLFFLLLLLLWLLFVCLFVVCLFVCWLLSLLLLLLFCWQLVVVAAAAVADVR